MVKPVAEAFGKNNDKEAMSISYIAMTGRNLDSLPPSAIVKQFPLLSKDKLRKLKIPSLIITGENTHETHKMDNQVLLCLLPNTVQATIAKARHGSAKEDLEAFNETVIKFIEMLKN